MELRGFQFRFAPESNSDQIVVSRRKLEEVLRELELNREEVERLKKENRSLKEKLDHVEHSLPVLAADARTAPAVGVPSSRTFFRRPPPDPAHRKSPGGQPGHPGVTRPRPVPNAPPLTLSLTNCPDCGHRLGEPCDQWSRPLTDIPEPRTMVYDLVAPRYRCPGCGKRVHAPLPVGTQEEFGPRVRALAVTLRTQGMSGEKIARFLDEVWGLKVSEATVLAWERGVAATFEPLYQGLKGQLTDPAFTPAAEGDETSFPVNGENGWTWVGTSATTTVYSTLPTRSQDGAVQLWGTYSGNLTHDAYAAYNVLANAAHQMDLVHVNRWLQKVEVEHGIVPRGFLRVEEPQFTRAGHPPEEFLEFAAGVRARMREEVLWHEAHPKARSSERERRHARAVGVMHLFLARRWKDTDVRRLSNEIFTQLPRLYLFLRDPRVSWTSNGAEREVRSMVVHRKLSGGRRTWKGAEVLDRLMTVVRTCRKRRVRYWDVLTGTADLLHAGVGPPSARPQG